MSRETTGRLLVLKRNVVLPSAFSNEDNVKNIIHNVNNIISVISLSKLSYIVVTFPSCLLARGRGKYTQRRNFFLEGDSQAA